MHLYLNFKDRLAKVSSLGHGNMKTQISVRTNLISILSKVKKKHTRSILRSFLVLTIHGPYFFLFKESMYI